MSRIVADADVVIAYVERLDANHARAVAIVNDQDQIVMHAVNMAELLVKAASEAERAALYSDLRDAGFAVYREPDTAADARRQVLALARLRARAGTRMPDTCALYTAERERLPLATFDERLQKAARAAGVTLAS